MITIHNKIIPFPGFKAINLFGVLFVRSGETLTEEQINHEAIHTAQMREMLYVFFYLWYLVEWLVRLFKKGNAYKNISFEQEAYDGQSLRQYLQTRQHYAWFFYYFL